MPDTDTLESKVWSVLNKRRWFGKHVGEDEMESLEKDLTAVLQPYQEDSEFLERLQIAGVDNWSGYEYAVSQEALEKAGLI